MIRQPDLVELFQKRVVLVTGKGGVGRTSVTVALARLAATRGKRVLVLEIADPGDDYSALAKLFGRHRLPEQAEKLEPGICGAALVPRDGQRMFLASVIGSETVARTLLASEGLIKLADAAPSLRELGLFFNLLSLIKQPTQKGAEYEYEHILVDMPATGHALALTGLPEIVLNLVPGGPIATAIREGQKYLNDPSQCVAAVVTLPEDLPVTEALELIAGLRKTKMAVGGVILNRMPVDPFSEEERALLTGVLDVRLHFGAEEFSQVIECAKVRDRLAGELDVPMIVLPETAESQPVIATLVKSLALHLGETA